MKFLYFRSSYGVPAFRSLGLQSTSIPLGPIFDMPTPPPPRLVRTTPLSEQHEALFLSNFGTSVVSLQRGAVIAEGITPHVKRGFFRPLISAKIQCS